MVEPETKIDRRRILKGAGLAVGYSVLMPLQNFANRIRQSEPQTECRFCRAAHKEYQCSVNP
jgi:hypothetical protein